MNKFPEIEDDFFYPKVTKKFKKYLLKPSTDSMKKICTPKKFKLQPSQKFLGDYINPRSPYKGILVFHKIGSGKTCTSITIAEHWKKKRKIVVVLPASLIGSFRDELRSGCTGEEYLKAVEKKKLNKLEVGSNEYNNIIKKSNKRINKYYHIYSYHIFIRDIKKISLKNSILIIDEIQNMISETGIFYRTLKNKIDNSSEDLRVVLLSATPIFDKPVEIALTLNLLRPENPLPVGLKFNKKFLRSKKNKEGIYYNAKNIVKFKKHIKGLISYYRGAPEVAFPEEIFKVVRCKMDNFQYKSYLTAMSCDNKMKKGCFKDVDILKLPNDFFLGPRMISNVAFPNKSIGQLGFSSFKGKKLQFNNLSEYSVKFVKILKKIKKSIGPTFVYSNFKEIGGLKSFIKVLKYHKYKNYKIYGPGPKRYAVWSGDEPHKMKEEIKSVFNKKENKNGDLIKIMLGSPSIKEGVSLLRVEQVHIIEPYWNMSRILQILGRGIRYCSHKDLPVSRRFVEVYLYLAVHEKEKLSVDQYIWKMAKKKNRLISKFETAMKEMAIDCDLFHARNENEYDIINCED